MRGRSFLISVVGVALAGCALVASLDDHGAGPGGSDGDAGDGGSLGDGAQGGDTAASVTLSFDPPLTEVSPGGSANVTVTAVGLTSDVDVSLSASTADGGVAPLSFDTTVLPLKKDTPRGRFTVHVDAAARHGRYAVAFAGPSIAAAPYTVRVVGTPGQLDTGFGDLGSFLFCPAAVPHPCAASDVLVLPDGSFVVAGEVSTSGAPDDALLVARFHADGTPDTAFGTNGYVVATVPGAVSYSQTRIRPMRDGSFVLAIAGPGVTLAHLLANGSLDRSWGTDGGVPTNLGTSTVTAAAAVRADGGFVAAGGASGSRVVVNGYRDDGGVDPAFGDGGAFAVSFGAAVTRGSTVDVDPAGRIVFGGQATAGPPASAFIARVDGQGHVEAFGTDTGMPTTQISHSATAAQDEFEIVVPHNSGYLAVAHVGSGSTLGLAITRFLSIGQLDTNFATTGTYFMDGGTNKSLQAAGLVVEPDGGPFVLAEHSSPDFYIAHFKSNGALDTAFGANGVAQPLQGKVAHLALVENGKQLIAVGRHQTSSIDVATGVIRVARYWLQ